MNDFFFPHTDPLALGGAVEKFRGNIAAIKALKLCQADNRPATTKNNTFWRTMLAGATRQC